MPETCTYGLELATRNREHYDSRKNGTMMRPSAISRRAFLAMSSALAAGLLPAGAGAGRANPAEEFVQDNIHKGLEILNNKQPAADQRRDQFEGFLLGLTDMKRIADFTLGQYRRSASPARPGRLRRRVPELCGRGLPILFRQICRPDA